MVIRILTCCVIIPIVGKAVMLHPNHESMYILPQELGMISALENLFLSSFIL